MSASVLLDLVNAEARYQDKLALSGINLRLYRGQKVALVGRSGSGKSTLLRLIYEKLPDNMALVPQDEGLVQTLSVYHNVYMGRLSEHAALYNLANLVKPFKSHVAEVRDVLERVQLIDKCFEPVGQLSGGQRQRTAIARSLYQGGELLLADEPVSAVDEQQSRRILEALCDDFPSVIMALHDTTLALAYCDRVIGLQDGKIILDQASNELSAADLSQLYDD